MVQKTSIELAELAARAILDHMERGDHSALARRMGISRQALSDLANGRRKWTDRYRDVFCAAVGMRLSELFAIGESLARGEAYFPHIRAVRNTLEHSEERAAIIYRLAAERYHLGEAGADVARALVQGAHVKYIGGSITDGQLLEAVERAIRGMLKKYV